jgi:hypothetical protein
VPLVAVIYAGEEAEARLQGLGLPGAAVLSGAIAHGVAAARTVTAMHPSSYRSLRLWAEATMYLRWHLPSPWEPEVESGVDLVVERERGVGIVVTKGDGAVGDPRFEPQVLYERGEAIQRLVNGSLDTLFTIGQPPRWEVWFLLHHLDGDDCTAELARPLAISERGWVAGWHSRLLLPAVGAVGAIGPAEPAADTAADRPVPEVDVPVARRVV